MNLFRLIALAVIVWLVVYMVKRALGQQRSARPDPQVHQQQSERVVRCARCGVHVPESKAWRSEDGFYCSPEHRDEDGD